MLSSTGRNAPAINQGGRSQLAFMRLLQTNKNLNTQRGPVTSDELSKHKEPWDCWISLEGNVFNVTSYLEYHPGGASEILTYAGSDATEAYMQIHPWVNYRAILEPLLVGRLVDWKPPSPKPQKAQPTVKYATETTAEFKPHRASEPRSNPQPEAHVASETAGPPTQHPAQTEKESWLSRLIAIFRPNS